MSIEPPIPSSHREPFSSSRTFKAFIWVMTAMMAVSILSIAFGDVRASGSVRWIYVAGFAFLAALVVQTWRVRHFNRELLAGIVPLYQRRLDQAATALSATVARHRRNVFAGPLARHNLLLVRLAQGDLDAAEALAISIERWGGLAYGSDARILAAIDLARILALRGDAALARRWLDDAERRAASACNTLIIRSYLTSTAPLVLVREGRYQEALGFLDANRVELAHSASYDVVRTTWMLEAFATFQLGDPRDQGAVDALVRRGLPAWPGEHAGLVVLWPELRAFLETHGVAANALARLDTTGAA